MSKAEWIEELLKGKIGTQSGNIDQQWKYEDGKFKTITSFRDSWINMNVNVIPCYREFVIIENTKMTHKQIEKALGITNLKIVGEDNGK